MEQLIKNLKTKDRQLNASGGVIRVGLASTASVGLKAGRYVYDVLITDSSNTVTRVVEGSVLVRAGVTTQ